MKKAKLDAWERGFRKIEREHFNTTKHKLYHKKYKGLVVPLELFSRSVVELMRASKKNIEDAKNGLKNGYSNGYVLCCMEDARLYARLVNEMQECKLRTWVQAH